MRTINHTHQFKKDFRREKSGRHGKKLDDMIADMVVHLAKDVTLAPRYCDHALIGKWNDHRDCHLKPDLVLIYRKTDDDVLWLVRLGSHSELGF
jgi:mRNA interferase YafQ